MKVLFIASEVTPIAKVGGLGDVVGALPKSLAALGVEVSIITGYYGTHSEKMYPTKEIFKATLNWDNSAIAYSIRQGLLPGSKVKIYYIDQKKIVGSGGVYDSRDAVASSQFEAERFLFISKTAAALPEQIGLKPDIWHLHDWHAAAVPSFLPADHSPTLLTIHNLANQGWADKITLQKAGLRINRATKIFGLGLKQADWLSTVSPTYAREIQSKPEGEGFERLLKSRNKSLVGITNGIDYDFFNPTKDKFLKTRLGKDFDDFKKSNRLALSQELALKNSQVPLFGIVTRLTYQKGLDLLVKALEPYLKERRLQFVCLGMGDPAIEEKINNLSQTYKGWSASKIGFDEKLAHMIYAASDFFLMPSRFEPCGLGQLIAMRYASVPIVRAVGGLKDTVIDINNSNGSGIVFDSYSSQALKKAIARGLELFDYHAKLELVRQRGQTRNSSWQESAQKYLKLYRKICH